jgi:hypothetical protein
MPLPESGTTNLTGEVKMTTEVISIQDIGLSNQVDLCVSCRHEMPDCGFDNVILGDGLGDDNTCSCSNYEPIELRHPKYDGCGDI